ncbi:zinc-binding oxidoreductase CipB [Coniochaeta ligniaria NRRL 30616]|uniref:Zinc-binding oxidoreductase CipB n=1 Tax=Coniochaeta ligniaria NRRL 30616 TaxID=1408157 RepID=A0A1J7IV56_9PEZI|nr:zinc-binding oxidoreductase CipB [Coniochaeta ligniaria NRRL 30616]
MAPSTLTNTAAWLMAPKARPFEIKPAPLGTPGENQILIRNHAIAINPIDAKIQQGIPYPMDYPAILGQDVAGEVVALGPNVTRFKEGDRVTGAAAGFFTKRNEEKAFQTYTVLDTNLACRIPDSMSFERAAVIPLGLATAACALFSSNLLGLQLPTEPAQKPTGSVLLVWGGASSVGLNAIQLAVAAGYEVVTTCSPKNFEYVKQFGPTHVFDYNSSAVVSDLVDAVKGKATVGAFDAVGGHAPSVEFVQKAEGVKFVATAVRGFAEPPEGMKIAQCMSLVIKDTPVGKAIWEDFLPKALEEGAFVPAPEPLIAGKGLEALQVAIDLKRDGVSAKEKVVVVL